MGTQLEKQSSQKLMPKESYNLLSLQNDVCIEIRGAKYQDGGGKRHVEINRVGRGGILFFWGGGKPIRKKG